MASSSQIQSPSDDLSPPPEPVAKKPKKLISKVWQWFDREIITKIEDGKEIKQIIATCKTCAQKFNGCSNSGTTHLNNHYNKKHNNVRGQTELNLNKEKLEPFKYDENGSRRKLMLAIVMHEYPFSIVEHEYFLDFIKSLRPSFSMKSRNTCRKEILDMYVEEKKKMYNFLGSLSCRFSGTMDLWTSRQNKSYMCVTVHFIDDNWSIQKRILNFMCLGGRHTGENLSEAVLKNLCDWNLDRKLFTFTLDNDKSNGVCIKKMVERLNKNNFLICNGNMFHIRCAAHIINLVVQDGLKKIKKAIEGVREIVIKIKNSPLLYEEFQIRAEENSLNKKRGLSTDVSTRWNSTYMMLKDAHYFREAFQRMHFINPTRFINFPSDQQWSEIEFFCKCLKNFYTVTEVLSGTLYPTSNLFFQNFCDIKLKIEAWLQNSNPIIVEMATSMKEKFDKYWYQSNTILAIASFLDPRYKMILIEFFYSRIYDNEGTNEIGKLLKVLRDLHSEYKLKFQNTINQAAQINRFGIGGSLGCVDEDEENIELQNFIRERKQPTSYKSDLDNYMERPPISNEEEFDILSWWKTEGREYPILSRIARDVLAIPVSTVASESAFSTGGRVVDPHRSRLEPEIVEALICMQDWVKGNRKGDIYF